MTVRSVGPRPSPPQGALRELANGRRSGVSAPPPRVLTLGAQEVGMLTAILLGTLIALGAGPDGLEQARQLWRTGRYAEALEGYDSFEKQAKGKGEAEAVRYAGRLSFGA